MKRVLLVDDKAEHLEFLEALLSANGFEIDTARHGAEALVLARRTVPDLVVSDLLMPVMDGYTLLRFWKSDERLSRVPFIVYTATYTESEDRRLALSLGADAFILKPAESETFLREVQSVLDRSPSSDPGSTAAPDLDEEATLELYSTTLIRKLEEKTLQLEEANRILEDDVLQRRRSEAELLEANIRLRTASLSRRSELRSASYAFRVARISERRRPRS